MLRARGTAPRIAIIVGSTRPGRKGSAVGRWVLDHAKPRAGGSYDVLELERFGLALLAEPIAPAAAGRAYENPQTSLWSRTIDAYDGFVWVTPEYNFGVPAAFKNALDLLYPEWNHKAVGFVAYGVDGGVRAVEQWRSIMTNVRMVAVRAQVSLSIFDDWQHEHFAPLERRVAELDRVLDELEEMAATLEPLRAVARAPR
ncbi:NADPH-dependent FMN reductase [Kribbella flavida DSM 17836]|uniref:NADPH-dependent FMN reductase n=1 Tax=Kribbella flavida (strain DSM 17836 / JCM 10339 / NBRC 14399) TaxID=479435 RepID=D2Q3C8_KRIFD|nr:NAD(P)H-dependent oxidoreductase [Kribbella flavida]ADB34051.1 NADPH-dependent FMN reductase [Kribbella flavida DSM 17836]